MFDGNVQGIFNPKSTELFNLNFQPLEVVSRYRDPQLQVTKNSLNRPNLGQNVSDYRGFEIHFFKFQILLYIRLLKHKKQY